MGQKIFVFMLRAALLTIVTSDHSNTQVNLSSPKPAQTYSSPSDPALPCLKWLALYFLAPPCLFLSMHIDLQSPEVHPSDSFYHKMHTHHDPRDSRLGMRPVDQARALHFLCRVNLLFTCYSTCRLGCVGFRCAAQVP